MTSWIGISSADWSTAADWSGGVLPTIDDAVVIQVPGITVSVSSTSAVASAYSLATQGSSFLIDGGTLQTVASATFGGNFTESSGTFIAGGSGAVFADNIYFSGGHIKALAGATINVADGGTLAGTFSGNGTLLISGGSVYIDAGFLDTMSSLIVGGNGGKLGLNANAATAGNFTLDSNCVVDLFGHTLTIAGSSTIDGIVGGGTLKELGNTALGLAGGQTTVLDDGLLVSVVGTVSQDGNISLGVGDSGAQVTVTKSGQYLINGDFGVGDPSATGTITNNGIFEKSSGGRTAVLATSLTSYNTVKVNIGTLLLEGIYNSIAGTVSGAGTLAIAGGNTTFGTHLALTVAGIDQQAGELILTKSLAYGGEWDMTGGVLNLNTSTDTLTLSQLNFNAGLITGYGGDLVVKNAEFGATGQGVTVGGPTTLTITGTLDQATSITFGASSNPVAMIMAGAVWSIEGDSGIYGGYGEIINAGTFIDPNGSGFALVQPTFINTSQGTVTVNNSGLQLQGSNYLAGKITGSGLLDLFGSTTLENGVSLTVAGLNVDGSVVQLNGDIAYAGAFSEDGNGGAIDLGGNTLALTGTVSLDGGVVGGTGIVSSTGAASISNFSVGAYTTLEVLAVTDQVGLLALNGGTLEIGGHATYTLDDDVSIGSGGVVQNAGTFISTGTGSDYISSAYDQTGAMTVDNANLYLTGGGTLGGAISGPGALQLDGGTYTLESGLSLSLNSLGMLQSTTVLLVANETFGGFFADDSANSTIGLNGATLSLTGTAQLNSTTLMGGGTLATSGASTLSQILVTGATVLTVGGAAEQYGQVTLNGGALKVTSGGAYEMNNGASIGGSGTLTILAGGTLSAPSDGTAAISSGIVDAGTISAALGLLNIGSSVSGSGHFLIGGPGATLEFNNAATITASTGIGFTAAGGDLVVADAAHFAATVSNFIKGDIIELSGFLASATGSLSTGGEQYTVTDGNGDKAIINFATALTSSQIYLGLAPDGVIAVLHH